MWTIKNDKEKEQKLSEWTVKVYATARDHLSGKRVLVFVPAEGCKFPT